MRSRIKRRAYNGIIEPIEQVIDGKMFILSKFPAIAGREIITNILASAMPKVGDYKTNEKMMLKLMSFVAIQKPGMECPIRLVTDALIDNHAGNWGNIGENRSCNDGVQLQFFSERASIDFLKRYRPESTSVDFQNVDSFIGAIIADGKATLNELRTIYTLEDALNMWEVIAITRYNEYLAMEHAKKQNRGK